MVTIQPIGDNLNHCCVIGGNGFIGSYLVPLLIASGRIVTVVDRAPFSTINLIENMRYVQADYNDEKFLLRILIDVDEVIDLAYATVPKTSFDDPVNDILTNLPPMVKLLEVACSIGLNKVVLVSSGGTVYGRAQELPLKEDHPTNPISPYGITKLAIEKYAFMYHELKSLPVLCVRPGNAYGARQRPFSGQGFVATAIASILQRKVLNLFGPTGTIRDYIHVEDIANGILAALQYGKTGSCYNIGTGIGMSNKDILDALLPAATSAGFDISVSILPPRNFDVPVNILDSTKLKNETGWEPKVAFEEGIKKTWEWYFEAGLAQKNGAKIR
ncbi:MAG: GDP-mannose 4,6-dehydratase [Desulfuromonadales bacterium]|nr:GDP-mannose 4,6-dehydratase [Desulfuromonadales bacterium]